MDTRQVDELRRLIATATPGPWTVRNVGYYEDAAYIAAFNPTTAAALLDEIESLRRVRDAAKRVSDAWFAPSGTGGWDNAWEWEHATSGLRAALLEAEPLDPEGAR